MLTNTQLFKIFAKDSMNRIMFIMGIGAVIGILIFIWQLFPFVPHEAITGNIVSSAFKDRLVVYEGLLAVCIIVVLGIRMFISASKTWSKSKYVLLPARVDQLLFWNLVVRFIIHVFAIFLTGIIFLGLEWFVNSSFHEAIVNALTSITVGGIGWVFNILIVFYLFFNLAVVTNNWLMGFVGDKWQQRVKVLALILLIYVSGYVFEWIPGITSYGFGWFGTVIIDILVDIVMMGLIWYLLRYHNDAK